MSEYQPAILTECFNGMVGNFKVNVCQDLLWAVVFMNDVRYEQCGDHSKFWVSHYREDHSRTAQTFDRLMRNMLDCTGPADDGIFNSKLVSEGRPVVAAWRKAHALALHFCEHVRRPEGELRQAIVSRWKRSTNPDHQLHLRTFLHPDDRRNMGLVTHDRSDIRAMLREAGIRVQAKEQGDFAE